MNRRLWFGKICKSDNFVRNTKYRTKSLFESKASLTFIGPCNMIYFCSKTNKMHQFLKFILFCSSTLHVSDGLSVHHHESKTVHTASGICHTDSANCLLAGKRCSVLSTSLPSDATWKRRAQKVYKLLLLLLLLLLLNSLLFFYFALLAFASHVRRQTHFLPTPTG